MRLVAAVCVLVLATTSTSLAASSLRGGSPLQPRADAAAVLGRVSSLFRMAEAATDHDSVAQVHRLLAAVGQQVETLARQQQATFDSQLQRCADDELPVQRALARASQRIATGANCVANATAQRLASATAATKAAAAARAAALSAAAARSQLENHQQTAVAVSEQLKRHADRVGATLSMLRAVMGKLKPVPAQQAADSALETVSAAPAGVAPSQSLAFVQIAASALRMRARRAARAHGDEHLTQLNLLLSGLHDRLSEHARSSATLSQQQLLRLHSEGAELQAEANRTAAAVLKHQQQARAAQVAADAATSALSDCHTSVADAKKQLPALQDDAARLRVECDEAREQARNATLKWQSVRHLINNMHNVSSSQLQAMQAVASATGAGAQAGARVQGATGAGAAVPPSSSHSNASTGNTTDMVAPPVPGLEEEAAALADASSVVATGATGATGASAPRTPEQRILDTAKLVADREAEAAMNATEAADTPEGETGGEAETGAPTGSGNSTDAGQAATGATGAEEQKPRVMKAGVEFEVVRATTGGGGDGADESKPGDGAALSAPAYAGTELDADTLSQLFNSTSVA